MKYRDRWSIFLFIGISLLFALVSCKSAPPEGPPPAPPPRAPAPPVEVPDSTTPDKAALDALDAAVDRAEQARQRALDFDAPEYFPPDWEGADGQYRLVAEGAKRDTREDVRDAVFRYDEAAAVFEDLFRRSLPLYAQDREDEILAARGEALDAGAEELLPEYLILADETALEALDRYEGEDFYPAAASAALARDLYWALKTGAEAYGVRLAIEDRDFYHYDPENFEQAEVSGGAAAAAYRGGNPQEAQDYAEEALRRYNRVLNTGRETLAAERQEFAREERRIALELKANVAVRRDFTSADAVYYRAELGFSAGEFELAADLYEEAGYLFIRTQRDTLEKRRIAEDAIRSAEEKMHESDETARKAELILEEGGEQ